MRALSLTQPWAWLVVHGGKDVENRVWNTRFRGQFLIHAAKGMRRSDYEAAYDTAYGIDPTLAMLMPLPEELERGGIVGVAELFAVLSPLTDYQQVVLGQDASAAWHFADQFGFRLRNIQPLPFLPCKGALSFWGNFEIRDGKAVRL